jgi:FkbM family methyltransferase
MKKIGTLTTPLFCFWENTNGARRLNMFMKILKSGPLCAAKRRIRMLKRKQNKAPLSRMPRDVRLESRAHIPPNQAVCFSNDKPKGNGESWFYRGIRHEIDTIFDVGASDSLYLDFPGTVHYFEPCEDSDIFKEIKTLNEKSYFNKFGLSDVTSDSRPITWETGDAYPQRDGTVATAGENTTMKTKTAADYMSENNIEKVDFVKIDTEGHELAVLKGFKERLNCVGAVQFEYGEINWTLDITLKETISYLESFGFGHFGYLAPNWIEFIDPNSVKDYYVYANIVCFNDKYWSDIPVLYRSNGNILYT